MAELILVTKVYNLGSMCFLNRYPSHLSETLAYYF